MSISPAAGEEAESGTLVMELTAGVWVAPALFAMVTLGIPDQMGDGVKGVDALAATVGAQPRALYRTMRALAGMGVFEETSRQQFRLTPAGTVLRSGVAGSLRDLVLMPPQGGREMLESVRTGTDSFRRRHGMGLFEYLELHPESSKLYGEAMTSLSRAEAAALLSSYEFGATANVVDVGGGHGTLMMEILKAHPGARGVVYDLPTVVEVGAGRVAAAGLAERCSCVAGSFFERVPAGADVYVLASILHDWTDEEATVILNHLRTSMTAGSRLLVVERIVPSGNERSFVKLLDLVMLVSLGGRERTLEEYRALLEGAGLKLTRAANTRFLVSVLEAELA